MMNTQLSIAVPDPALVRRDVAAALAEDIGSGDITAALIPADSLASATIIARESGILCGTAWANEVFAQLSDSVQITWHCQDGENFAAGTELAALQGPARPLMTGERSALNFLQTLSATATVTAQLVAKVAHTGVRLLDTRKTLPGLRTAQKYAVLAGGGQNHRIGLFDAFLIKENHIAACGGITTAVNTAHAQHPDKPVEIEVQDLAQLDEAIAAGADIVMLDNFPLARVSEAVQRTSGRVKLEASGGIEGDTLVKIAETGVDYISIGALTKHCRAIDLSLLLK